MKDTLEEYFNVNDTLDILKVGDNDTLDTLKGGNSDRQETEKKIAVAIAKTAENAAASTTSLIERVEEEKSDNNENNENENDNENENNYNESEFSEDSINELMKKLESENSVIQTHLY